MHIKNIHSIIERLSECVKCEVDKGIEQVDTKEMGEVADIIKDLCEAEYYAKISKAMDEAEYGEDYDYMGAYDEHERKGYRGQRRDSRGRYMSRRIYTEPMMMHDERREADYMDGKMYYDGEVTKSTDIGHKRDTTNKMKDMREGRSGESRRGYMESKEMGKDKSEKMHELETYMKDLSEDVTEMIGGMSPEEKALMKNKMQTLMTKIQ